MQWPLSNGIFWVLLSRIQNNRSPKHQQEPFESARNKKSTPKAPKHRETRIKSLKMQWQLPIGFFWLYQTGSEALRVLSYCKIHLNHLWALLNTICDSRLQWMATERLWPTLRTAKTQRRHEVASLLHKFLHITRPSDVQSPCQLLTLTIAAIFFFFTCYLHLPKFTMKLNRSADKRCTFKATGREPERMRPAAAQIRCDNVAHFLDFLAMNSKGFQSDWTRTDDPVFVIGADFQAALQLVTNFLITGVLGDWRRSEMGHGLGKGTQNRVLGMVKELIHAPKSLGMAGKKFYSNFGQRGRKINFLAP